MISRAWGFVDDFKSCPIVCGITQIDEASKVGRFRYGKRYLSRNDAFTLDPINLPLNEGPTLPKLIKFCLGC